MALVMMFGFFLASCGDATPEVPALSSIAFSGVGDVTLDYDEAFNVKTGVTALGNDSVDYTSSITWQSLATISTTGDLDTTIDGIFLVKYVVQVDTFKAEYNRYITVNKPQAIEGEMLVNADFSLGITGWDTYSADGSSIDLSVVDGALQAVVVAGSNIWTPRITQMGVPFEIDKTYEISFDAKSSVAKTINLQVGEILAAAPWFTDFKPNITIHKDITTEWATYSYKFTMPIDDQLGGVLFELGTIGGVSVDATMWFDNITIEESTPDVDLEAPVISGAMASVNVLIDATYDPAAGVTAFDITDGDVTDQIVITIADSLGAAVTAIDTSAEAVYTVTYTVEDSLGNSGFATTTVNIVGLLFSDTNLIKNPSFTAALDATTPEWTVWSQDWGTAPVVVTALDNTAGTFSLDITGGGDAAWAVQLTQNGYLTLEQGKTYRLSFDVAAEVARSLNIALGYGDPYVQYARSNGIAITTTEDTYEYLFTVTQATHDVKLTFELGSQTGFADGLVTFYNVALQELDVEPILTNGDFNQLAPWVLWFQDWGDAPTVTAENVAGEFVVTTDKAGDAFWAVQFNQLVALEAAKTYTLSYDAKASVARDINVEVVGSPLAKQVNVLTTEMQTFTVDFTTTDAVAAAKLSFEMGATDAFAAGSVTLDNISLVEKDVVDAPNLVVNGDASTVYGGHTYDNAGSGVGTAGYSDTGFEFVVTGLGGAAYTPHYYVIVDELAAGDYTVTFTLTSSVTRDFRFNMVLPDAGYSSILPDSFVDFNAIADEMTTFTVNFTLDAATTNIKVELDLGTLGGTLVSLPGTFTLHEIMVYPNFN